MVLFGYPVTKRSCVLTIMNKQTMRKKKLELEKETQKGLKSQINTP